MTFMDGQSFVQQIIFNVMTNHVTTILNYSWVLKMYHRLVKTTKKHRMIKYWCDESTDGNPYMMKLIINTICTLIKQSRDGQ